MTFVRQNFIWLVLILCAALAIAIGFALPAFRLYAYSAGVFTGLITVIHEQCFSRWHCLDDESHDLLIDTLSEMPEVENFTEVDHLDFRLPPNLLAVAHRNEYRLVSRPDFLEHRKQEFKATVRGINLVGKDVYVNLSFLVDVVSLKESGLVFAPAVGTTATCGRPSLTLGKTQGRKILVHCSMHLGTFSSIPWCIRTSLAHLNTLKGRAFYVKEL